MLTPPPSIHRLPSLRQLAYLVQVADALNFTQAAESCFVTQSTLSSGIRELEALLGTSLLERDKRRVRLTAAGEQAVARARTLLVAARDLVSEVSQTSHPMQGRLQLGAIPTIAPFLLPPLVSALNKQHPGLQLILREDTSQQLMSRLADGRLDLALIALPYDTEDFLVRPVFDDELWLITPAPDGQEKCVNPPQALDQFLASAPWPLILMEEGHCLREHTLQACPTTSLTPGTRPSSVGGLNTAARRHSIEASSLVTLVQMVSAGLGMAVIPGLGRHHALLTGDRIALHPLVPAPTRKIALVMRPSAPFGDAFRAIAQILTQHSQHTVAGVAPQE